MRVKPLVSTEWLFEQLITKKSQSIVVLDGTWHLPTMKRNAHQEYLIDRLPVSDHQSTLPHMLPSSNQFSQQMGKLGISNNSHVVVYDASSPIGSAARVLWTFRAFGHEAGVSVLDGGLKKWKHEQKPTEAGAPKPQRNTIQSQLGVAEISVVDARPGDRFYGRSLPSQNYVNADEGHPAVMLNDSELEALFASKQVDLNSPVTHTCGSGVNASIGWLATIVARLKNQPLADWKALERDVAVYDGSWSEWGSREADGAVIENKRVP
ncbi:Rhodanese-like domain-containing protein [Chytridium lagenaria]|nr:Rhodanese-like domain-containing protein [Chytridium lagenaria]